MLEKTDNQQPLPPPTRDISNTLKDKLTSVATATLAGLLQGAGFPNNFLAGLKPLNSGQRMAGIARTLRYLPIRPDLAISIGHDVQRTTIESIQPGEVLVIDARYEPDAGTIGDIYSLRAMTLGAAGVITDGALRDTPAIKALGIPVYHQSSHGTMLGRRHTPADTQIPICCAGVTVLPGDVIVGDDEGVVVIPADRAEEFADAAIKMEAEETFMLERIRDGGSTYDYFPLGDTQKAEYTEWRKKQMS